MRLTIDRIEEEFVICENAKREMINLPLNIFPIDIKDGDIILYEDGEVKRDNTSTQLQKKKIEDKMKRLSRR